MRPERYRDGEERISRLSVFYSLSQDRGDTECEAFNFMLCARPMCGTVRTANIETPQRNSPAGKAGDRD